MKAQLRPDRAHSKAIPDLISKLLVQRQEVFVLLNRLAELKPYHEAMSVQLVLQRFCQELMDYVALGHFEFYQCIGENARDTEGCRRVRQLANKLYPNIAKTTQIAVEFNDRYDNEARCKLGTLSDDLSCMGEKLADRIELEDRLIRALQGHEFPA